MWMILAGCVTTAELNAALDRDGDGYLPIVAGGPDCDEARADVNPGQTEICGDQVDNDCDGIIDDIGIGNRVFFVDADNDGFGTNRSIEACTLPPGYAEQTGDCDDSTPAKNPAAEDFCDGIDQDCDGLVDDDAVFRELYEDADGDGAGNPDVTVQECLGVPGYLEVAGDCDDTDASIRPGVEDPCNGVDDDCDGIVDDDAVFGFVYDDNDGDGIGDPSTGQITCALASGVLVAGDCDDADPNVRPGLVDDCDGVDTDCDGVVDDQATFVNTYVDADGDGAGDPETAEYRCDPIGRVLNGADCDDADARFAPNQTDGCDGLDQDCDGVADDDAVFRLLFRDVDGDGAGDADVSLQACDTVAGFVDGAGDCDDEDPAVRPGAEDLCNDVDDDCDGGVDEDAVFELVYTDADGDGVGGLSTGFVTCNFVGLVQVAGDCDDADPNIRPGLFDDCDGVDTDCDGAADEDAEFVLSFADVDGDGAGDPLSSSVRCDLTGRVMNGDDCNDGDAGFGPNQTDICDGLDQDCDGVVDDDVSTVTWFPDVDGDGIGALAGAVNTCSGAPEGFVALGGDCDDEDAQRQVPLWYADGDGDGFGAGPAVQSCERPEGFVAEGTDCDDGNVARHPAMTEECENGVDDDCDDASRCRMSTALLRGDSQGAFELDPAGFSRGRPGNVFGGPGQDAIVGGAVLPEGTWGFSYPGVVAINGLDFDLDGFNELATAFGPVRIVRGGAIEVVAETDPGNNNAVPVGFVDSIGTRGLVFHVEGSYYLLPYGAGSVDFASLSPFLHCSGVSTVSREGSLAVSHGSSVLLGDIDSLLAGSNTCNELSVLLENLEGDSIPYLEYANGRFSLFVNHNPLAATSNVLRTWSSLESALGGDLPEVKVKTLTATCPQILPVGDLDGDEVLDSVCGNEGVSRFYSVIYGGQDSFERSVGFYQIQEPRHLLAGFHTGVSGMHDFDLDGYDDLLVYSTDSVVPENFVRILGSGI